MLYLEDVSDILYAEFDKLAEEFKIDKSNCNFIIASDKMISYAYYKRLWKFEGIKSADELMEKILHNDDDKYDGTLMYNTIFMCLKNGKLVQLIIFPIVNLFRHLYYNHGISDEDMIAYFKQCLRHEVGHMIWNQSKIDEFGINEGNRVIDDIKDTQDKEWLSYIENLDYNELDENGAREYYTKYFNLEFEKCANEAVGLSTKDMVDFEIILWKAQCDLLDKEGGV